MADKVYRTLAGVVQFDPQERDVNGKTVLSVTIKATGVKEQAQLVSCTLWPSHKKYFGQIEKGTALIVEGTYDVKKGQDGEGNPKTYHNLSVNKVLVLGTLDPGEEVERTSSASSDSGDDEDAW